MADYEFRWRRIKELGQGGQGMVHLVEDLRKTKREELLASLRDHLSNYPNYRTSAEKLAEAAENIYESFESMIEARSTDCFGALKIINRIVDEDDQHKARLRLTKEIECMSGMTSANFLKILDFDSDGAWYVSEYFPQGTLSANRSQFRDNLRGSLLALRPLVEAVADLHEKHCVHRDIKPDNIFVCPTRGLVLGDFGLVFRSREAESRLTASIENVGSWQWMPQWTGNIRVEDVRPTFDVFSLGKVLWSMVSGQEYLHLWYFRRDGANLEELFPENPCMRYANELLSKCIVEEEKDCLPSARGLLAEIDNTLAMLDGRMRALRVDEPRPCHICGKGTYRKVAKPGSVEVINFGIKPAGNRSFLIFACDSCGHVELFASSYDGLPQAWNNSN